MSRKVNAGMTLVEVLIGVALLTLVLYGATAAFSNYAKLSTQSTTSDLADEQIRIVGLQLQKLLEGTRGLQNLSFKVPGFVLQCASTGYCVQPNSDYQGKPSSGNDLLFAVTRVLTKTDLQLSAPVGAGTTSLSLVPADGVTPVSSLVAVGDYLVVTNIQSSEMVQVTSVVVPAPPAAGPTTAGISATVVTFIPAGMAVPTFSGNYVAQDFVLKARISQVGIVVAAIGGGATPNRPVGTLQSTDLASGITTELGTGFTSFTVQYDLSNATATFPGGICPPAIQSTIFTTPGTYSRANWTSVNANDCYPGIAALSLTYNANTAANNTRVGNYVFKSATY